MEGRLDLALGRTGVVGRGTESYPEVLRTMAWLGYPAGVGWGVGAGLPLACGVLRLKHCVPNCGSVWGSSWNSASLAPISLPK